MKNFNIAAIIMQAVCGLICIGMGIYYCFTGTIAQIAIFMIVGAVSIVNAVRMYISNKKNDKDE